MKLLQTPEPGGRGHPSPGVSANTHAGSACSKMAKAAQLQASISGMLSWGDIKENYPLKREQIQVYFILFSVLWLTFL